MPLDWTMRKLLVVPSRAMSNATTTETVPCASSRYGLTHADSSAALTAAPYQPSDESPRRRSP
jgi:hypothetical protein